MTKDEARAVLNSARDGQPVKQADITVALWETGDRKPIVKSAQLQKDSSNRCNDVGILSKVSFTLTTNG